MQMSHMPMQAPGGKALHVALAQSKQERQRKAREASAETGGSQVHCSWACCHPPNCVPAKCCVVTLQCAWHYTQGAAAAGACRGSQWPPAATRTVWLHHCVITPSSVSTMHAGLAQKWQPAQLRRLRCECPAAATVAAASALPCSGSLPVKWASLTLQVSFPGGAHPPCMVCCLSEGKRMRMRGPHDRQVCKKRMLRSQARPPITTRQRRTTRPTRHPLLLCSRRQLSQSTPQRTRTRSLSQSSCSTCQCMPAYQCGRTPASWRAPGGLQPTACTCGRQCTRCDWL